MYIQVTCCPASSCCKTGNVLQLCHALAPAGGPVAKLLSDSELSHVQQQRRWLRQQVQRSTAPVTIVASGSVLFGAPSRTNQPPKHKGYCSGDDWDCYRPAQQALIAELARLPGCVIVITGDYHAGDIKRIAPGDSASYAQYYSPPVCVQAELLNCTCIATVLADDVLVVNACVLPRHDLQVCRLHLLCVQKQTGAASIACVLVGCKHGCSAMHALVQLCMTPCCSERAGPAKAHLASDGLRHA